MLSEKELLISFFNFYPKHATDKAVTAFQRASKPVIILTAVKKDQYTFRVASESTKNKNYLVQLELREEDAEAFCECPAFEGRGACKHVAQAVIYLMMRLHNVSINIIAHLAAGGASFEAAAAALMSGPGSVPKQPTTAMPLQEQLFASAEPAWHTENSTPSRIFLQLLGYHYYVTRAQLAKSTLISLTDEEDKDVVLTFDFKHSKNTIYRQLIKYDRKSTFSYHCDCAEHTPVCTHIKTAFSVLDEKYNRDYFVRFKNYDDDKNALLKPYGLTVTDKEAADFRFKITAEGSISMYPPTWLWKADLAAGMDALRLITTGQDISTRPKAPDEIIIDFEIGFLFNLGSQRFKTGFELETIKITAKGGKPVYKKLIIHDNGNLALLKELPDDVYQLLLQLDEPHVKKHLEMKGVWVVRHYASPWSQLDAQAARLLTAYYFDCVRNLWPYLCTHAHTYMLKEKQFSNSSVKPARLSPAYLTFSFSVTEDERYITIALNKMLGGEVVVDGEVKLHGGFVFEVNGMLCIPDEESSLDMLRQFAHGFIKIPVAARQQVIKAVIPQLQQKYAVDVASSLMIPAKQIQPAPQVLLKEMENKFLLLQPQFVYEDVTVNYDPAPQDIFIEQPGGETYLIARDKEKEQAFFDSLCHLHPRFEKPALNNFFFVPFEDTMKQNWFIEMVAKLVEDKVTVIGMQELQTHRYNTNKAKWEMKAGSGIDWFDLQIQVSFGDQVVSLRDIRAALLNRQTVVRLGDGTFGVLPGDWLQKFGMLLKMGEDQKDGTLRVSKLHYTLIDELHSQIDDEDILREINEKKQRLQNIGNIKTVKPSKLIKATLRPYQLTGFQWMQMLDEMGWGGCLADDMGLGKTLQAITFLQYLKTKYKGSTQLVICPTSLVYNWESELAKFSPSLKYHIYYGLEREFSETHFTDYDVIITSYGILRNDLEELMKFSWHYIILDESQAIKNPEAQTNKALQLLKSTNRMILSGTPIQNNTYDLFAQFHFINPGLLGNREFFKSEFATPIDKNNDAEKTAQLRRLIHPFMLRRTKEQVAKDLPDKTETILWCEMGKEQRTVYNEYKEYYRTTLLDKIEEVGMAKAGMYVLEGLLRLRQICDSPVLVKDSEVTTTKSIKIKELLREIEENAGGHKMLVFSQFTEMLHIIEENLNSHGITYVYLDGSTPAEKRKDAVNEFQQNEHIRVFLISLKAGGVGLNLTAADYVYIVDPWWNPAVEQQAIDRTHRIGQQNKIFAYKMICKDTVEEKILQLQQRKKQLASDLVTEDAGFIKKLTKDDIAFLFS